MLGLKNADHSFIESSRISAICSCFSVIAAFQSIDNLKDNHLQILQIHYQAHEKTITAKQLAQAMGYSHHTTAT